MLQSEGRVDHLKYRYTMDEQCLKRKSAPDHQFGPIVANPCETKCMPERTHYCDEQICADRTLVEFYFPDTSIYEQSHSQIAYLMITIQISLILLFSIAIHYRQIINSLQSNHKIYHFWSCMIWLGIESRIFARRVSD